jgi:putative heme-binding domain-containing protein
MRTRPAAHGLDRLLSSSPVTLSTQSLRTVIETYRHIQVEPSLETSVLEEWLTRRDDAPVELQVAALTTLGMLGGDAAASAEQVALRLLEDPRDEVRLAVIQAIGELRLLGATHPLVSLLSKSERSHDERRAALASLSMLRAEGWPFLDRGNPGVELVLDDLLRLLDDPASAQLHADILSVVGQIDLAKAVPAAERMLSAQHPGAVAAAVDVLGTDLEWAQRLATSFREGQLPPTIRPNIAAALQRHLPRDTTGELATLLHELFRTGLQVSLRPDEVARIETLVRDTGDANRGREIYLQAERSQCAKCHRLEGVGGEIGPDLTRVWQTHSVAKILESIVEPAREIKEGFATWSLESTTGQVFVGLKLSDTPREVVLRDANGRDIRIPREQIESLAETRQSIMPEGTVGQLAFTELIDLLAFLKNDQAQRSLRHLEWKPESHE